MAVASDYPNSALKINKQNRASIRESALGALSPICLNADTIGHAIEHYFTIINAYGVNRAVDVNGNHRWSTESRGGSDVSPFSDGAEFLTAALARAEWGGMGLSLVLEISYNVGVRSNEDLLCVVEDIRILRDAFAEVDQ